MKKITVLTLSILSLFIILSSSFSQKVSAATTLETCYDSVCVISQDTLYKSSISTPGEQDMFRFTLSTSGYYVIETYGELDTYMKRYVTYYLYTNDNGGEKLNANMGFSGTAGTQYYVYIKAASSTDTGYYYIQVRKQTATIMTFDYGPDDPNGIDTRPDAVTPIAELSEMGYTTTDYQNQAETILNSADSTGLNRFNKEVVMFSGHGNAGFVSVVNAIFEKTYLYSNELPYMGNTKLVVWATCYSSLNSSTQNSMALQSITNGAVSSIGWPDVTWEGSSRTFTNYLFMQLNYQKTVSVAASYAASKLIFWFDPVKDYEIFGDANRTLYSSVNNKQNTVSYVPTYSSYPFTMMIVESPIIQSNSIIGDSSSTFKSVNLNYIFEGEQVYRHYRMYNGYATNEYYDIMENSKKIINTSSAKISASDIEVMNSKSFPHFNSNYIDKILDEYNKYNLTQLESYNLYIKIDGKLLPIIVYSVVMR
jgi:hypothetical protein